MGVFLGLKPQAQSYHPFGIRFDNPFWDETSLAPVRKIDATPAYEDEYEMRNGERQTPPERHLQLFFNKLNLLIS